MKMLMINYTEGGGGKTVFYDLYNEYKLSNDINYVDLFELKYFPKDKYFSRVLVPFYSLFLQLSKNYDLVFMNGPLVFPIGRNLKCVYKTMIHHPFIYDFEFNKKTGLISRLNGYMEKISVMLCKNIITVSEFSKKKLLELYPHINCEIVSLPINPIFKEAKEKYKNEKKINAIFLPNIYRGYRKGGDFITPILIKISPLLKNKKIKLLISNEIIGSEKNYEELSKNCDVELLGNLQLTDLAKLYSTSLFVLTPATLEGYGLVPLEVIASGGRCISAPFPSLGFDNVSVNTKSKKAIVNGVIVLEHDSEMWEKEIIKLINLKD